MPEAPRRRPEGTIVLLALSGHIRARPRAVFDALDSHLSPGVAASSLYRADPSAFLVIAQGGGWYRAEYRVVPDESGSNVEHSLLNMAPGRFGSAFAARRFVRSTPADFERLLKDLRLDLE